MPKVCQNGKELFFIEQGKGKPLFFIHGLGGDHHLFDPQIEVFSRSYRLILPHNLGNGLSGVLEGPPGRVLDQQCDDLAALCRYLGIEHAVFCGTSYGGVLCFNLVLRYPDLVEGLIIADSFSDTRIVGLKEGLIVLSNYISIWTSYLPVEWLIPFLKWRYHKWPEARNYAIYVAKTIRKRELALQRRAVRSIDLTKRLKSVHCHVLGVVGDMLDVPVRAMTRSIGSISGAKLEIVKNSFDPTNLCQGKVYNTLVQKFLSVIGW